MYMYICIYMCMYVCIYIFVCKYPSTSARAMYPGPCGDTCCIRDKPLQIYITDEG